MHDGGTGEVLEAHLVEPAFPPCPGADNRVDDRRQNSRKGQERPQLHPLGQRPRHDRGCGGDKDHLKEPVRHGRVALAEDCGPGFVLAGQQGQLIRRGTVQEGDRADPGADIDVHEVIADEVEGQPGD